MKFFIACTAAAVIGLTWLLSMAADRINSLERRLNTQGETIDTINRSIDSIGRTLGHVNETLITHSRLRDMGKMPDAPPLRWVSAGPSYISLQFYTEKDGWQYIPKGYKNK